LTQPQPGTGDRLSVGMVIRSLNEEKHIGRLLTGVAHQTVQPDEIVLVDSGSTDATVEIATRFGARVVTIAPKDFSFGRSLNLGCAALDTDVLVFASAHVYPLFDTWLQHLVRPLEESEIALSYGRQVGDHRTKFSEQRLLGRWFPAQSIPRQSQPFCNNANAAVRRSVWKEQPYDEDLTGLEDLDWARRAIAKGHVLSYVAEAPVVHVHEESWQRLRDRYRREAIAHKRIYEDQRLSAVEAVALGVRHIAADYASAARQGALLRNLGAIPSFHAAQFLGAYQGFAQVGDVPADLKRRFYYPVPDEPDLAAVAIGRTIDYAGHEDTKADSQQDPR
jgi:rhamnosyltransferase